MAAGFADICGLMGVWLGGRKATVVTQTPRATPSLAGNLDRWRTDRFARDFDLVDEEVVRMVREAIEEAIGPEATTATVVRPVAVAELPTAPEIDEALNTLFLNRRLSAVEQAQREAVRRALQTAREEAQRERESAAYAAFAAAAREAEEEAAAALLLLM